MKNFILILALAVANTLHGQTCQEFLEYVESNAYGKTLYSPTSTAIQKVTFYSLEYNYETYHYAVVTFNNGMFGKKYIYQVGSRTYFNYLMDYMDSAGRAFWEHIQPYGDVLGCGPDL